MPAKAVMVQGTGSGVGKSILVTSLCRLLRQDGYRVAPFKAQNMSLNSFVTREGGEMGRAQVAQAEAAGVEPAVVMNPILIKPEADARSQVVVLGRPAFTIAAGQYYRRTPELWRAVVASLEKLMAEYEVVVIEGAGSPAEVNLREREIVNMRVAQHAAAPVLLVGDIDKGGVFASLVGTLELLEPGERELVRGFIINKFRGDLSLLSPGLEFLERRTGIPVLGVVPFFHDILINEEDSIHRLSRAGEVDIAVIYLPRLSNSTDFEPLQQEPGVSLRYVRSPRELREPDVIILPGTKSTIADLEHLRRSGLAEAILAHAGRGGVTIGICGGFQMLGQAIRDPLRVESALAETPGLGLLEGETVFEREKATYQISGEVAAAAGWLGGLRGEEVEGYEIHMGHTQSPLPAAFWLTRLGEATPHPDGAVDASGRAFGTYLHGLFDHPSFRSAFLRHLRQLKGLPPVPPTPIPSKEEQYRRLADLVRGSLDMERLYRVCRLR